MLFRSSSQYEFCMKINGRPNLFELIFKYDSFFYFESFLLRIDAFFFLTSMERYTDFSVLFLY